MTNDIEWDIDEIPAPANVIEKIPQPPAQAPTTTPDQLIALAVQSGADVERLEKLMDLQERWENRQAAQAFADAMAMFQGVVPTIKKKKLVSFESRNGGATTSYKYAPLGDIMEQIREPLETCGLHVTYRHKIENGLIYVTARVTHRLGHYEETTLESTADTTGNKNSVQQIGSTVTFLSRYAVCGVLGIVTADEDIDGRMVEGCISDGQVASLRARIEACGANEAKFCQAIGVGSLEQISQVKYGEADSQLARKEAKVAASAEELK